MTSSRHTHVCTGLLVLLAGCWTVQADWPCSRVERFVRRFSGQFSSLRQHEMDNTSFWMHFTYAPVNVTALHRAVTFYYEQGINSASQASRRQVYAFYPHSSSSSLCGGLRQAVYDIQDSGRFNLTEEGLEAVSDLDISELTTRPECDSVWRMENPTSFRSELVTPDLCTFDFRGQEVHPEGWRRLAAHSLTIVDKFVTDSGTVLSGSDTPIVLDRFLPSRFPLPDDILTCPRH